MNKLAKIIEYLFYAFIFILPWQTRWIWHSGNLGEGISQYLTLSLYCSQILLWVVLVLGLIYCWKNHTKEDRLLNVKLFNFYILGGAFFLLTLLSLVFAHDKLVGWNYFFMLLQGGLLILLIINFKFSLRKIGLAFVAAGVIQSLLAIYQFLIQAVFASKWLGMAEQVLSTGGTAVVESTGLRWLRAYGAFSHPNILGGYLAVSLIMLIVLIFLENDKRIGYFLWASLPVISFALFFTFSKSAWLALGIGLFFILLFVWTSQDRWIKFIYSQILLIMFLSVAIFAFLYQEPLLARVESVGRLENKSGQERVLYFNQAKNLIIQNWYKGVGLGNYTSALYANLSDKQPSWYYQPVHNVYLLIATEVGLAGFVFFMLFIIQLFREIYYFKYTEYSGLIAVLHMVKEKVIREFYCERLYWFLGSATIFLMLLVIMVFDHYLWTQYFGIMLGSFSLGLLLKQIGYLK